MSRKPLDRRELLRLGLTGSIGSAFALEQLGGVPLFGTWASELVRNPWINRHDAYAMMGNALRGGPALLGVHKAMAAGESDWALVEIKVVNHVYTPLVFRLGALANGAVTTDADVPLASARCGRAKTALTALGVDQISDMPRYQALRFNKWFARILHNGTSDGQAVGTANSLGLSTDDIAPLDDTKVAIQAFVGLQQIETNNHALKGLKLRSEMPDITLFAQESELITSPLGISCFMMGGNYDKAEGSLPFNAVLGKSNQSEDAVVSSRSVAEYVGQISQFVGKSYVDRQEVEANLVYKLDQLVDKDPKLRRELLGSIEQFKAGLASLQAAGDLETQRQTADTTVSNLQSAGNAEVGASKEFLAQCKYVARSLALPGMPVRNFSLFLNISDLDTKDLDLGFSGGGGNASDVKAYSYIEGMRQLGMGLNVLAKSIAAGKKMIVYVHSEGGRDAGLGDSKTSFALVLGPKGSGNLDDRFFGNMSVVNASSNAFLKDPGNAAAAMAWDVEDAFKEKDGTEAANSIPATGDVGMGVVQFLEEKTGKQVRSPLGAGDGRYVKLKRA